MTVPQRVRLGVGWLKVFQTTAAYDGAIAAYLSGVITTEKKRF